MMKPTNGESPTVLSGDSLVPLESVLCTEELNRRPRRPPEYEAESRALVALAQALADAPQTILQKMAEIMLEMLRADSAGVSLLTNEDGGKRFFWPAIAGVWKPHIGGGTPRDFGPCGDVLDRNAPLLFKHLERRYTYFLPVTPSVEEALLVPFYVAGKAVGTIWVIAHDDRRKFDAEDLRQLVSLSAFASSAYQVVALQDASAQRGETLRQSQTQLAQRVAELQQGNAIAQDLRRAALNLMEDAVQSRQAMETFNAQLRESEERFRNMADSASTMVWVTDPDSTCTYLSKSWFGFTGQTPRTGLGFGWMQAIHPDDQKSTRDTFFAATEKHESFRLEIRIRRKDGRYCWAINAAVPRFDANGELLGYIGSVLDITERKQTEALLSSQKQALEMAAVGASLSEVLDFLLRAFETQSPENAQVAIHLLDESGARFQQTVAPSLPPAYARAVDGMAVSSATGTCCAAVSRRQLVSVPDIAACQEWPEFASSALPLGLRASFSLPIFSSTGIVLGTFVSYYDEVRKPNLQDELFGDVVARTAAIVIDGKRAEAELEQRVADRTEELMQSHKQLTSLATELNLAEQRERKRLAGDLHDHLGQLLALGKMKLQQSMRMTIPAEKRAALIAETDAVLTDAMTYMRTLVADLSPPILYELGLPAALRWLGDQMRRHELAVTVQIETDELQLAEDRAVLLFQSVREMLVNAVKHAKAETATVRLKQESGTLRIEVQDQGAGFVLDAVADPGTDAAMTSKFGLFSIRERMKALGGRFELHSSPGQGTMATLTLPLGMTEDGGLKTDSTGKAIGHRRLVVKPWSEGAAPEVINHQPSTSGSGDALPIAGDRSRPIRVLLVDDHAMVRRGLRSVLESYADVEVVGEAWDGEEAVAAAEALQPSHIVMDINMPQMNGIEATARIKSRYPYIIVIGLSVNAGGTYEEAMKQAGAAMLLTKEVAVDELYSAIHRTLSGDARSGRTISSESEGM